MPKCIIRKTDLVGYNQGMKSYVSSEFVGFFQYDTHIKLALKLNLVDAKRVIDDHMEYVDPLDKYKLEILVKKPKPREPHD